MNIIEMAKEAGFVVQIHGECFGHTTLEHRFNPDRLEAFAALVRAEALAEPVKQEPVVWATITKDCIAVSDKPFEDAKPLYAAPVDAKAIRALKLVYDNSTSHDWPEDIWEAIEEALK
jgi:hypothetical protein